MIKYICDKCGKEVKRIELRQIEVLDATENATITLITCTVGAKQRVIVKGTLQSTEDL